MQALYNRKQPLFITWKKVYTLSNYDTPNELNGEKPWSKLSVKLAFQWYVIPDVKHINRGRNVYKFLTVTYVGKLWLKVSKVGVSYRFSCQFWYEAYHIHAIILGPSILALSKGCSLYSPLILVFMFFSLRIFSPNSSLVLQQENLRSDLVKVLCWVVIQEVFQCKMIMM